ncbi:MAG: hypothetical protein HYZ14_03490 [Bacteroidetes bacterium]|nr:hypothetical protein [Bacteroidota bacterium]
MYSYIRLIFVFGALMTAANPACALKVEKPNHPGIFIYQNGAEFQVKNDTVFQLPRNPFSIRYFSRMWNEKAKKFYTAQIAGFVNKSEMLAVRTGMKTDLIPCFSPGTGMAPDRSGFYTEFIIRSYAHHYLLYENEQNRRVQLISAGRDFSYFDFAIASFYIDDMTYSVNDFPYPELFLVVFIDDNLNNRTDAGELTRFTIQFKA